MKRPRRLLPATRSGPATRPGPATGPGPAPGSRGPGGPGRALFPLLLAGLLCAAGSPPGAGQPSVPAVSAWERGPDLPLARAGAAAAWLGDRLVVAGGSYWEDGVKRWTARVDAFDPAARRWEPLPPMPAPTANSASATDGERLFVVGGAVEGEATGRCWQLGKVDGQWRWEPLPALPRPGIYGALGWLEDRLCYAGGSTSPLDLSRVTGEVYRLDPRRPGRGWAPAAPLPGQARAIAGSAVSGRQLFLFGGCYGTAEGKVENLAEVLSYDAAEDRWRRRPPLPRALRGPSAAPLPGGRAALLGGYSGGPDDAARYGPAYGFERRTLVYELATGRSREGAPLPAVNADGDAVFREGRLYLVGGEDRARSRTALLASTRLASLLSGRTARPIWFCMGDSVTHGVGRSGVTEQETYPSMLQKTLARRSPPPWVINGGVGGESTRAAVQRFPAAAGLLPRVDVVVLMYGLNDAALVDPGPRDRTEPRVPLEEYRRNLRALVEDARRQGARPVLCTPNPMTPAYRYADRGLYAGQDDLNFLVLEYAEAVRKLGRELKVPVADVYRRFERTRDWAERLPDGIHPDARGLTLIADEVRRVAAGF